MTWVGRDVKDAEGSEGRTSKAELQRQGITLPQWSRAYGFKVRAVRAVLYGDNKGLWGNAHKIAVALGLKAGSS